MLKGVIFDMDGTITLTEDLHYQAFQRVFHEHGISYEHPDHIRRFTGAGSKVTFETIFKEQHKELSPELLEVCMVEKKKLYKKIVQESEIPTVKGVHEFLEHVESRGLKKIIATGNADLDAVRFILKKAGLLEFFPDILSITEVAHGKPFPDVFFEALKRLGLAKDEAVVLEDAVNGVTAAHEAGIRCIALETTSKREDLLAAGAEKVVKDYYEIIDEILNSKS